MLRSKGPIIPCHNFIFTELHHCCFCSGDFCNASTDPCLICHTEDYHLLLVDGSRITSVGGPRVLASSCRLVDSALFFL